MENDFWAYGSMEVVDIVQLGILVRLFRIVVVFSTNMK